jgi:hypothetical protein
MLGRGRVVLVLALPTRKALSHKERATNDRDWPTVNYFRDSVDWAAVRAPGETLAALRALGRARFAQGWSQGVQDYSGYDR